MSRYLKDEQYYIDRYDLHTIEGCLDYYNGLQEILKRKRDAEEFKKFDKEEFDKEEFDKEVHKTAGYVVNIIKAKRYKKRKR